jgi:hypothetical protein
MHCRHLTLLLLSLGCVSDSSATEVDEASEVDVTSSGPDSSTASESTTDTASDTDTIDSSSSETGDGFACCRCDPSADLLCVPYTDDVAETCPDGYSTGIQECGPEEYVCCNCMDPPNCISWTDSASDCHDVRSMTGSHFCKLEGGEPVDCIAQCVDTNPTFGCCHCEFSPKNPLSCVEVGIDLCEELSTDDEPHVWVDGCTVDDFGDLVCPLTCPLGG